MYQFERGLFTEDEFEVRRETWRYMMGDDFVGPPFRNTWDSIRELFAQSFRAEIDRIVGEVGG